MIVQSKKVRFEDEDNANKQGDVIEDKSMKGNQGKYVDMICWIKTCILVARSMEISRVLYYFIFAGSASGASCKDESTDKQMKKDDHNDGGSNDGANADKKSGTQLVLNACNNLYWFSSIFSFWRQQQLMFYVFFKVSTELSSHKDQSGDKSKGVSSQDDDKGAKDDDKTAKDDDKASKDDVSIRDDGKQGKHTFLSVQQQFLYQ